VPGELLVNESEGSGRKGGRSAVIPWDGRAAARAYGWIGSLLVLAALVDYALALVPSGFGNPEWETATVSLIVAGLPLVTIGMFCLWVSTSSLNRRWLQVLIGLVFLAAAAITGGMLALFATNIPMALRATQGESHLGIQKLILKTLILGSVFGVSYLVMGVLSLRQARGVPSMETGK